MPIIIILSDKSFKNANEIIIHRRFETRPSEFWSAGAVWTVQYTLCTPVYPVYPSIPCIPLYTLLLVLFKTETPVDRLSTRSRLRLGTSRTAVFRSSERRARPLLKNKTLDRRSCDGKRSRSGYRKRFFFSGRFRRDRTSPTGSDYTVRQAAVSVWNGPCVRVAGPNVKRSRRTRPPFNQRVKSTHGNGVK